MAFNGLSTIPASDSHLFNLKTPRINLSTNNSLKFSSVRLPPRSRSRSISFKSRALSFAHPSSSSSSSSELSFYELLGIPESGSLLDIKQAYKQLARKYHPDVSPPGRVDEFTQMFILVHQAYETLSDPERRASYDRCIHFASSASPCHYDHEMAEIRKGWRAIWEAQLENLKNRTTYKYGDRSHSWASQVRQTRNENEFYN